MKKFLCVLMSLMFTVLLFSPAYASFKPVNELVTDPGFAKLPKYNTYSFDGKDFSVDEVYNDDSGYYSCLRNSLNDNEKLVYDELLNGLLVTASDLKGLNMFKGHGYEEDEYKAQTFTIDLENIEFYGEDFFGMDFFKVLYSLTYDRPDFFWLNDGYAWQCKYMDENDDGLLDYDEPLTSLYLEIPVFYGYYQNDGRGNGVLGKYNNIVNKIKSFDFSGCKNRYEFLKKVHDYVISFIDYDETLFNCYDLSGALIDGKSVCMGYSFAVKAICNYYKIPCAICTSSEVPESETNNHIDAHMWNAVLLDDGKWYYIDTTWDDHPEYTKEKIIYDYFLCGSKSVASHFGTKFSANHLEQSPEKAYIANVAKSQTAYVYDKTANTKFDANNNPGIHIAQSNVLNLDIPYLKDYIYYNGLAYNINSSVGERYVYVWNNGVREKWTLKFTGECSHTETEEIVTVPATCIAEGKKEKVCKVCGEILETVAILQKTSHTSDGGTVTLQPTCKSEGEKEYKCVVCKKVLKTEKVAKAAHTYNKYVVTRATLTANGKSTLTCSVCGAKKSTSTVYYPKTIKLTTTSYYYDGKAKKPSVKVTDANGKTISSSNYTVTYKNNTAVGTATATVTFKGNYYGTKTLKFTISGNKVSGLKVSTVKTTSIGLKWTKVTGAKYYKVEQSTDGKKWKTITTASKNSCTVSKLTAGKKYQFRVTALDSAKKPKGVASDVLKTGTLTSAPKLTVKSSKSKTATVTWKKVTGASKYVIYKSTDSRKWISVSTVTGTSCTLTKLAGGKKIYVMAVAVNAYGKNSAYSSFASVKVKK